MSTQYTFSWDSAAPQGAAGSMTLERTSAGVWSIVDDPSEPDGATHATISQTAVANKISIGYVDFGAWVAGWSFDDTYVSGTYSGSVTGNWSSSFVSLVENTTGGGGTNTEGVAIVEWQGSFTKNPGNDYWRWNVTGLNTEATDSIALYDYLPTLSSTEPPIGVRTFAASSSPTSQYGLFTPDLTKTYYIINYLSGSSNTSLNQQVLATKNFANKKVHCNFW